MGRPKFYTQNKYEEAAQDAAGRMGRKSKGYTKDEILDLAGFDGDQRQHWPKLRKAFGRIGVTLCYVQGSGWSKGTVGDEGNVVEMWHRMVDRLAKAFRPDIIAAMQNSDSAEQAVSHLVNEGLDPLTFVTLCHHANERLPEAIEAELLATTAKMLPEMPEEMRARIEALGDGLRHVAGLLSPPPAH